MAEPTVFGLPLPDLPDGWMPLQAIVVVTALDETGERALSLRSSSDVASWEAAGMAQAAADAWRAECTSNWGVE